MRLLYGPGYEPGRTVLALLAALAALHLLCEVLDQALFARGSAWLAALGWAAGLPATALSLVLLQTDLLHRVSVSLALGAAVACAAYLLLYLAVRRLPETGTGY